MTSQAHDERPLIACSVCSKPVPMGLEWLHTCERHTTAV